MSEYSIRIQALEEILRGLSNQRIGVAVSGGIDSRLLAFTLVRLKLPFTAVHATGPHLSPAETAFARRWLAGKGIRHMAIRFDPLQIPAAASNDKDRCYHCKLALFSGFRDLYGHDAVILEGSNATDATEYRPGRRALEELGILSPYALAELTKDNIRQFARETGLDWPDQPARACLMTRFAYGLQPDADTMLRLGKAEDALADTGLTDFRLRIPEQGKALLQISTAQKSLAQTALDTVKSLLAMEGFRDVDIVFAESISGYFDRTS
ncbi:ATP-dependent sacrificial sulfur transferase LarE [Desulfovibrio mangrovi]|uniref:ATP-dependent sacrificial sulfur transferase LarE n=1 Tax=Desulfovibrio mangrovi TaxID=2976983 RepID=UPI002247FF5C|nr:ATP-dependent sacrificial sulfur transferase LarE [Desulfovibrio mangrovi]UZP67181.1 ATP-dependent sacrificial sulfur transferase LarE [Desulfovibrio mangrovi]